MIKMKEKTIRIDVISNFYLLPPETYDASGKREESRNRREEEWRRRIFES